MLDFEIDRCTRRCAATDRELAEGEEFYSVLVADGAEVKRRDYSTAAWTGPPEKAIGWWKSRMPTADSRKPRLAPNEVLLNYFRQLADHPEQADVRYVLALWLVRRRVLRMEEPQTVHTPGSVVSLYSPRDDASLTVEVAWPADERVAEIEHQLARLLYADDSAADPPRPSGAVHEADA